MIFYQKTIEEVDREQVGKMVMYIAIDTHYYVKEWLEAPKNHSENDKIWIAGNFYSLAPGQNLLPAGEGVTHFDGNEIEVKMAGTLASYKHENM